MRQVSAIADCRYIQPAFSRIFHSLGRDLPFNLASEKCARLSSRVVAREFKPVRFFVMMGVAAFIVCGVTAFYTHRAAHGRTAEERAAYWIGEKAGEQAPCEAKLPTDAELNMTAQKYFEQQGSGNKQNWDLAFENGYQDGFKKTHP
jgi:hypothetical protein